jgi:hypothetical protein
LETHLKLLREAKARVRREPDLYKLLAAALRVLVCEFGQSRPLLLDLMDELGVEYRIGPDPTLPIPIPLIDEPPPELPSDYLEWDRERVFEWHLSNGRVHPLREFVKRALAVMVGNDLYSYEQLVRTLAEHTGLAHEDASIDRNVIEMESVRIGGMVGHSAPLLLLASHVLSAGKNVISKAASLGYQPHYFQGDGRDVQFPPLGGSAA